MLAERPNVTTLYSQGDEQTLFLVADRNASLTCLKDVHGVPEEKYEVAQYENVDCAWFGHVEYCLKSPPAMIKVRGSATSKQSMHFAAGLPQGGFVPPRAWQWTRASLERLFKHALHGPSIRNALDAVLMPNLAQIIETRTDQALARAYSSRAPPPAGAAARAAVASPREDLAGDEVL